MQLICNWGVRKSSKKSESDLIRESARYGCHPSLLKISSLRPISLAVEQTAGIGPPCPSANYTLPYHEEVTND